MSNKGRPLDAWKAEAVIEAEAESRGDWSGTDAEAEEIDQRVAADRQRARSLGLDFDPPVRRWRRRKSKR